MVRWRKALPDLCALIVAVPRRGRTLGGGRSPTDPAWRAPWETLQGGTSHSVGRGENSPAPCPQAFPSSGEGPQAADSGKHFNFPSCLCLTFLSQETDRRREGPSPPSPFHKTHGRGLYLCAFWKHPQYRGHPGTCLPPPAYPLFREPSAFLLGGCPFPALPPPYHKLLYLLQGGGGGYFLTGLLYTHTPPAIYRVGPPYLPPICFLHGDPMLPCAPSGTGDRGSFWSLLPPVSSPAVTDRCPTGSQAGSTWSSLGSTPHTFFLVTYGRRSHYTPHPSPFPSPCGSPLAWRCLSLYR